MKKNEYKVIGKETRRIGDVEKAMGKTVYVHDMKLPNMLHGKILRSNVPHARILRLDTSKARELPGVRAVITARDVPAIYYGPWTQDKTLFAADKVRYVGEEIAAVAAEDRDAAEEALELIEVEYQELPAVFHPVEAMKPEAVQVHEDPGRYGRLHPSAATGNVASHTQFYLGDVEKAFREADEVVEDTFTSQIHHQLYLERRVAIASFDAYTGALTVWASSQSPFLTLSHLAAVLQMPTSRIRVITPPVGGAFGGKANPLFEGHAAFLSKLTARPVKIELSREEDFVCTNPRHASVTRIKIGARANGEIIAYQLEVILDNGAYAFEGPAVCDCATVVARGPYWFPNYRIDGYSVLTNKIVTGAFRGFGDPQVSWARESALDMLAHRLGMEPAALRKKNTIKSGKPMVTGQVVENSGIDKCIAHCEELHGLGRQPGGKDRGRGCGFLMHPSGLLSSSAFIKIHEDGSVALLTGAAEIGGGQGTVLAMIVAEELGIPLEKISTVQSDTAVTPYDLAVISSRTAYNTGNAVKLAAADAKSQILALAAGLIGEGASAEELELRDGVVQVKGKPERRVAFETVAFHAHYFKGGPILGRGTFYRDQPPRDEKIMKGVATALWPEFSEGIQVVDVEVDRETGLVTPLHVGFANDVGKAINPLTVSGQMEGGVGQGIGFALMEQYLFDNGKMVNPSLLDYSIPTAMDVPSIRATWIENPSPSGPFGARGVGEPALVPTAPAIANAIYRAVGVRIRDLPITPDKVLRALREGRGK